MTGFSASRRSITPEPGTGASPAGAPAARPRLAGWLLVTLVLALPAALAAMPLEFAAPKPADVDLKITVAVPQQAVAAGAEGEAVISFAAPAGIKFNKYPPIRVTVEENPPIEFEQTTVKVGLDSMPDNPELNHFDSIEPIHLKFKVGPHNGDGKIPIKGKVKLTYCVAKSGYCAPLTRDLSFSLPIQSID